MIPMSWTFPTRSCGCSRSRHPVRVAARRHRSNLRRALRLEAGPDRARPHEQARRSCRDVRRSPASRRGHGQGSSCVQRALRHARGRKAPRRCCCWRLHRHGALHAPRTVPVRHRRARNHDLSQSPGERHEVHRRVSEPKQAMQTIQLAISSDEGTPGRWPSCSIACSRARSRRTAAARPRDRTSPGSGASAGRRRRGRVRDAGRASNP